MEFFLSIGVPSVANVVLGDPCPSSVVKVRRISTEGDS